MTFRDIVAKAAAIERVDGRPERLPSQGAVDLAQSTFERLVGQGVPGEIVEMWQVIDTIGADGTILYPPTTVTAPYHTLGIVEANESYPPPVGMAHIGSRDDDQISWRGSDGRIFYTDVWSNEPLAAFDSLTALAEEILEPSFDWELQYQRKHGR